MKWNLTFLFLLINITGTKGSVNLRVTRVGPFGVAINASWNLASEYRELEIRWDSATYVSEPLQQVTFQYVGHQILDFATKKHFILENLKMDQQYRICVRGDGADCSDQEYFCAYSKVPRYNRIQKGPHLYLVFGPILSTSLPVSWAVVPKDGVKPVQQRNDIGYKLEWRRVDGRVSGHPGHSSNVVSAAHMIRGLQPATRYEICIGETLTGKEGQTCDLVTTEEDYPGPPQAESSTCYNQAQGTHWRCDVVWSSPRKPNGKIKGYVVFWRDKEGYDLIESAPRGSLCDPVCVDTQILNFHPYEACVRAKTSVGIGWEDCVLVADIPTRILAFFELRILSVIFISILVYQYGLRILKSLLRCCIRTLYVTLEQDKQHPV